MIVPQSISEICSITSFIKLAKVRLRRPILKSFSPKYKSIHKFELYKYALTPYTLNLATRKIFVKIALKRGFRFDHDNWYVNNIERPFFPTEIKARRELARFGLISKNHYRPQMIQFDVLDDPRWQGRFRLVRYRPFAFQHISMVYNSRDHNCIPNATDNPWANCPGNNSELEYHVIHTLGWTLQLTNINLTFDVASKHMYYGKICIKSYLERGHCPPNHAIKTTVTWEPENHCRIFDVGRSQALMIKFQKSYFIETLENKKKLILVTNTCLQCILVVCKNTFMMKMHFHVLRFSRNLSKNVMKTAHIVPLNNKTFLYNTKKVLIWSRGNHNPTLITHTKQSLTDHPF